MKWFWTTYLVLFSIGLAILSFAGQNVPFTVRSTQSNQSIGALNQNFNDVTGRNRDRLVPIVSDQACGIAQALLGATEKGGYIFGGTCSAVLASSPVYSQAQLQSTAAGSAGIPVMELVGSTYSVCTSTGTGAKGQWACASLTSSP